MTYFVREKGSHPIRVFCWDITSSRRNKGTCAANTGARVSPLRPFCEGDEPAAEAGAQQRVEDLRRLEDTPPLGNPESIRSDTLAGEQGHGLHGMRWDQVPELLDRRVVPVVADIGPRARAADGTSHRHDKRAPRQGGRVVIDRALVPRVRRNDSRRAGEPVPVEYVDELLTVRADLLRQTAGGGDQGAVDVIAEVLLVREVEPLMGKRHYVPQVCRRVHQDVGPGYRDLRWRPVALTWLPPGRGRNRAADNDLVGHDFTSPSTPSGQLTWDIGSASGIASSPMGFWQPLTLSSGFGSRSSEPWSTGLARPFERLGG